eukprot:362952-Chlamydomonas_euryale.AAC.10
MMKRARHPRAVSLDPARRLYVNKHLPQVLEAVVGSSLRVFFRGRLRGGSAEKADRLRRPPAGCLPRDAQLDPTGSARGGRRQSPQLGRIAACMRALQATQGRSRTTRIRSSDARRGVDSLRAGSVAPARSGGTCLRLRRHPLQPTVQLMYRSRFLRSPLRSGGTTRDACTGKNSRPKQTQGPRSCHPINLCRPQSNQSLLKVAADIPSVRGPHMLCS